jgi:hypothetical protein
VRLGRRDIVMLQRHWIAPLLVVTEDVRLKGH